MFVCFVDLVFNGISIQRIPFMIINNHVLIIQTSTMKFNFFKKVNAIEDMHIITSKCI